MPRKPNTTGLVLSEDQSHEFFDYTGIRARAARSKQQRGRCAAFFLYEFSQA